MKFGLHSIASELARHEIVSAIRRDELHDTRIIELTTKKTEGARGGMRDTHANALMQRAGTTH